MKKNGCGSTVQVPDVNALVYAFRPDVVQHGAFRAWLNEVSEGHETLGIPDIVLLGLVRVSTNPRAWAAPSSLEEVLAFADELRHLPTYRQLHASPHHWPIFATFSRISGSRPDDFTDNCLAALAMENEAELISADKGFARFPGLRWRDPSRP